VHGCGERGVGVEGVRDVDWAAGLDFGLILGEGRMGGLDCSACELRARSRLPMVSPIIQREMYTEMVLLECCSNTWSDGQNERVPAAPLLRGNTASGDVGAGGEEEEEEEEEEEQDEEEEEEEEEEGVTTTKCKLQNMKQKEGSYT
jgi:hypothetical protein